MCNKLVYTVINNKKSGENFIKFINKGKLYVNLSAKILYRIIR